MKKLSIKIILVTLGLALSSLVAQAYSIPEEFRPNNAPLGNFDYTSENAGGITITILQILAGSLLYFAAPVAIIITIMAAFTLVIGGADSEKTEQAKKHLTWSVVGLFIIILSYSIVKIIISLVINAAELGS